MVKSSVSSPLKQVPIGMFVILEIYNTYNTRCDVSLNKIPQKLQLSFLKQEYQLKGIIFFKLPPNTRKTEKNVVGHFTAVSFQNNQWWEYDDCRSQPQKLPTNYTANIQIAIYTV